MTRSVRAAVCAVVAMLFVTAAAASIAWADGGVFPRVRQVQQAAAGPVRTPDQRALLRFDAEAGVETLVIETTVTGDGTEFAWVLPLPAAPTIEASTTGLFPTLRTLSPVDVWTDATPWWIAVLTVGGLLVFRRRVPLVGAVAVLFLGLMAAAIFVPQMQGDAFEVAKYISFGSALPGATPTTVRVLSRETVGAFDTTVLTARDASDLRRWFDENGYAAPPSVDPVLDAYLRDGWVFVASKVRAAADAATTAAVRNVHPLAFTFPAREAVYPMRLTGAVNETLDVELYVFADRRAEADGFQTTHCVRFDHYAPRDVAPVTTWTQHAEIVRRAGRALGVTRLVGTLDAAAMRRDVTFRWSPLEDERPLQFTTASAATVAADAAAILLIVGLFVAGVGAPARPARDGRPRAPRPRSGVRAFVVALVAGAVVWFALPTIGASALERDEDTLADWFGRWDWRASDDAVASAAREIEAGPIFHDAAAARAWVAPIAARAVNPFSGAPVREEDSPGNYVIEERDGAVLLTPVARWGAGHPYDLSSFARAPAGADAAALGGVVRDARGAPLAGARVVVTRATQRANVARDAPREAREATTSADGSYRVVVPAGFVCDVVVDVPQSPLLVRDDVDLRAAGDARLDLVVADGVPLRGRVVDRAGRPVAGAEVAAPDGVRHRGDQTVEVAADGTFALTGFAAGSSATTVVVHVHRGGMTCPRAAFPVVPGAAPADLVVDVR